MLNPDFSLEQAEWIIDDINTTAFATAIWIKRAFKSFETDCWDDRSFARITQALEMKDPRPVQFFARGFDLTFYGLNQPPQMEFDPEKGFVWKVWEPRFVLDENNLPLKLSQPFSRIFGLVARNVEDRYNLTVQQVPKSLIFSTNHYAWGITEFQNTVPLSSLVRNRQQFP